MLVGPFRPSVSNIIVELEEVNFSSVSDLPSDLLSRLLGQTEISRDCVRSSN